MVEERSFHEPVMVDEVLELLAPAGAGLYLDATVGGGGHARALLERVEGSRVFGIDRDPQALDRAREALRPWGDRVELASGRFDRVLERGPAGPVFAGALMDLGISSWQLDRAGRGFAFQADAPLDMRMDPGGDDPTAAELLNEADEEELRRIFKEYGDVARPGRLVREVVRRRRQRPFATSGDLVAALAASVGRSPRPREKARVFQALRMEVNREVEALERALPLVRDRLKPGAVLAVIGYHSVEDRLVKNAFRDWSRDCVCPPGMPVCTCRGKALGSVLTSRPLRPAAREVERNPRARSARLRGWRKG